MNIDVISAITRALSFIAIFQATGMAIFLAMFGSRALHAAPRIRSIAMISACAGILFVSLHYVLEAARMAGEIAGTLDPDLQRLVLHSSVVEMAGLRILGLALILVALNLRGTGLVLGTLFGASCLVVSFTLAGHTATHAWWLAALLVVHLAVVMFWFGSLLPLILIDRMEPCAVTAAVVEQFSRVALWMVPAIFVAGLILMAVLIDGWANLFTAYGLILLAKIGAFAVLMGLAALNRWRLGPALATQPSGSGTFQRSVLIEYVLIIGVLAATAALTTFFSPESSM
jgi:putative copper export protein